MPKTIWTDIKMDLELKIIDGTYKSTDKMPSVLEIARKYAVAGKTAGRVMEEMHKENTLVKKRGIGFFVMPYATNKLKKKHNIALQEELQKLANYAKKLAINKEEFSLLASKTINRKEK